MSYRTATLAAIACALAIIAGTLAASLVLADYAGASTGAPAPRAVALSDANVAPTHLVYLWAGAHVTMADAQGFTCTRGRGWYVETSAYRWNGAPLSAQRWNRSRTLTFWRDPRGGRVTFDGITFRNRTARAVLVAGWCE